MIPVPALPPILLWPQPGPDELLSERVFGSTGAIIPGTDDTGRQAGPGRWAGPPRVTGRLVEPQRDDLWKQVVGAGGQSA